MIDCYAISYGFARILCIVVAGMMMICRTVRLCGLGGMRKEFSFFAGSFKYLEYTTIFSNIHDSISLLSSIIDSY